MVEWEEEWEAADLHQVEVAAAGHHSWVDYLLEECQLYGKHETDQVLYSFPSVKALVLTLEV